METNVFKIQTPGGPVWFPSKIDSAAVALTLVGRDDIPPAAVTDLLPDLWSDTEVWLAWTAPGDDGNTGTAVEYDLRWRQGPITEGTFESSNRVMGMAGPGPAGTLEVQAITGLMPCTAYWFALKTRDDFGNWSALSNVAQQTTLGACGGGGFGAVRAGGPAARLGGDPREGAGSRGLEREAGDPGLGATGWAAGGGSLPPEWLAGASVTAGTGGAELSELIRPAGGVLAAELRMEGETRVWSLSLLGSEGAAELAGPDSAGIVYQVPGGGGAWLTGARLRPGEGSTRFAIGSATRPRRLVFLGEFGLEFAARAVRAEAAGIGRPLEVGPPLDARGRDGRDAGG